MGEDGRQVPIQTLQDAIRYGEVMPAPRGLNIAMYTVMYKNEKRYNWKEMKYVKKIKTQPCESTAALEALSVLHGKQQCPYKEVRTSCT